MPNYVRSLLVLSLAAAIAAPAAKAAPTTPYLDGLRDAMQARYLDIPVTAPTDLLLERAALAKSLAAFRLPSSSVDGDLRIFLKAAKPVEGLATITSTPIPDELNTSFYAFRGYVGFERDALPAAIDALVDPVVHAKAQQGLDAADAALVLVDASTLMSVRAAQLRVAHAAVVNTAKLIAKATACRGSTARPGKAYVACFVDDTPFVPRLGGAAAGADGGADSRVSVTGYSRSAQDPALEISWDNGAFTGVGTYSLDGTSGALAVLVADGQTFVSESGQIVVTEFDPAARRIVGTFSGVVTSATFAQRVLTAGVFKTCYAVSKR